MPFPIRRPKLYPIWFLGFLGIAILGGCENAWITTQGASAIDARTLAVIEGVAYGHDALDPRIREAAGALALEEFVLERALERECARRGVTIAEPDLARERRALAEAVGQTGALDAVRRERGLGPERFASLVRRNAMLRALVGDRVRVTEDEIALSIRLSQAPSRRVLAALGPSGEDPAGVINAMQRAARDGTGLDRVADALRTDDALVRLAVHAGMRRDDPAHAEALRRAAFETPIGGVSSAVSVEGGWAVLYVEREDPPAGEEPDPGAVRASLRAQKERVEMDRLARELIAGSEVRVLDRSLGWAWRTRPGQR